MFKLARSRQLASAFKRSVDAPIRQATLRQRRNLSIHEYRSAQLLDQYGIGVPKGAVAHSGKEAEE
ncbi:succinate--CoA ligase beta chain, partial [Oleoguttula sp. CCFEE 5521]